jgi:hypothetical protein
MTPDDLKALVASLMEPIEALHGQLDADELHDAAHETSPEERSNLFKQMRVLLIIASKIKAAIGNRETDLFGVAADTAQVMNLLCAVDEDRLSIDVIDRLCFEMAPLFGNWTALPPDLYHAMCRRAESLEEEMEAAEAEEEANDQTKH